MENTEEILQFMIDWYDKRGGGHSQKLALAYAINCIRIVERIDEESILYILSNNICDTLGCGGGYGYCSNCRETAKAIVKDLKQEYCTCRNYTKPGAMTVRIKEGIPHCVRCGKELKGDG